MKKSQSIYEFIRRHEGVSKQDIARGLLYSLPTITNNLRYLSKLGLIDGSSKIANTGGRHAIAYRFVKDARIAIGMFLTKNHINTVAVDLTGTVIATEREKRIFNLDDDTYLRAIACNVEKVREKLRMPAERLLGVGISVPGLVTENGEEVYYGLTLKFTGKTRAEIAKYIPYPNRLYHDSLATGYAEVWGSPEEETAFYINLGNSIGGAFVIDGIPFAGETQKAGEIGHMTVVPKGGELCYCGKKGCLDTVCTTTLLEQYADGGLEDFFALLEREDAGAQEVFGEYLDWLAIGIHNIRMLFDCRIIIGGHIGPYMSPYMDELVSRVNERNPFDRNASDYLRICRYKIVPAAAGAAIYLINDFLESL